MPRALCAAVAVLLAVSCSSSVEPAATAPTTTAAVVTTTTLSESEIEEADAHGSEQFPERDYMLILVSSGIHIGPGAVEPSLAPSAELFCNRSCERLPSKAA